MTTATFKPSKYQTDIFDFVTKGRGSAVVDAVPGSGKTTTCVEASSYLKSDSALFLAFNKHIAEELKKRLPSGIKTQTIHSLGMETLKRIFPKTNVDGRKYSKLIRQQLINDRIEGEEYEKARDNIAELLSLTQLTLTNPESETDLLALAEHFDLDLKNWEYTWRKIAPILEEGKKMAFFGIDFNDMVWLPNVLDLYPPSQYDWVIADEAQDLNRAQLELVLKSQSDQARALYVGDKRQAIMGFAGADSRSISNIISRTNSQILPLSICYRCPSSHIALANQVWAGIEPRPDAPKGVVDHIDEDDIAKLALAGDLIICRTNAPLIKICFALIRSGIPAKIRGRDIGKNLISIVTEVMQGISCTWQNFTEHLKEWEREEIQSKQHLENPELAIQGVRDRTDTILAIYQHSRPETQYDLERAIANLFSDERASVWLSTVHKAKGLEAERVFILRPELMPHPAAKKLWEQEAEKNIKFVALTRAKSELYFAYGDGRDVESSSDELEDNDDEDEDELWEDQD